MRFFLDADLGAVANFCRYFTGTEDGRAKAVVRRGQPEMFRKIWPAHRMIMLAAPGAKGIHQQKWTAVIDAGSVIFGIAHRHVRRGEVAQRAQVRRERRGISVKGNVLAMIGPEWIAADLQ